MVVAEESRAALIGAEVLEARAHTRRCAVRGRLAMDGEHIPAPATSARRLHGVSQPSQGGSEARRRTSPRRRGPARRRPRERTFLKRRQADPATPKSREQGLDIGRREPWRADAGAGKIRLPCKVKLTISLAPAIELGRQGLQCQATFEGTRRVVDHRAVRSGHDRKAFPQAGRPLIEAATCSCQSDLADTLEGDRTRKTGRARSTKARSRKKKKLWPPSREAGG